MNGRVQQNREVRLRYKRLCFRPADGSMLAVLSWGYYWLTSATVNSKLEVSIELRCRGIPKPVGVKKLSIQKRVFFAFATAACCAGAASAGPLDGLYQVSSTEFFAVRQGNNPSTNAPLTIASRFYTVTNVQTNPVITFRLGTLNPVNIDSWDGYTGPSNGSSVTLTGPGNFGFCIFTYSLSLNGSNDLVYVLTNSQQSAEGLKQNASCAAQAGTPMVAKRIL